MKPKPANITLWAPDPETMIRLEVIRKRLGLSSYSKAMIRLINLAYEGKTLDESEDTKLG